MARVGGSLSAMIWSLDFIIWIVGHGGQFLSRHGMTCFTFLLPGNKQGPSIPHLGSSCTGPVDICLTMAKLKPYSGIGFRIYVEVTLTSVDNGLSWWNG